MTRLCSVLTCLFFAGLIDSGVSADEKGIGDFPQLSAQNDWPWWRGPLRNGVADQSAVPVTFSETDHVIWKTPVPGRGHSSPTVVGNRVFLTTATTAEQIHEVLAFDRTTGKPLWRKEVNRGGFPVQRQTKCAG